MGAWIVIGYSTVLVAVFFFMLALWDPRPPL